MNFSHLLIAISIIAYNRAISVPKLENVKEPSLTSIGEIYPVIGENTILAPQGSKKDKNSLYSVVSKQFFPQNIEKKGFESFINTVEEVFLFKKVPNHNGSINASFNPSIEDKKKEYILRKLDEKNISVSSTKAEKCSSNIILSHPFLNPLVETAKKRKYSNFFKKLPKYFKTFWYNIKSNININFLIIEIEKSNYKEKVKLFEAQLYKIDVFLREEVFRVLRKTPIHESLYIHFQLAVWSFIDDDSEDLSFFKSLNISFLSFYLGWI